MSDGLPVTSTASASDAAPGLLPARMLNEFAYRPRLRYLEWVQGEFADNVDTVEGEGSPSDGGQGAPGELRWS